jgi:hypothetical protein
MRPVVLLLALAVALSACGGNPAAPNPERFCEIHAELDAIDPFAGSIQEQLATGQAIRELLDEAARVAPEGIAADSAATLEAFEALFEIISDGATGGIDGAVLIAADAELNRAHAPIREWTEANCAP